MAGEGTTMGITRGSLAVDTGSMNSGQAGVSVAETGRSGGGYGRVTGGVSAQEQESFTEKVKQSVAVSVTNKPTALTEKSGEKTRPTPPPLPQSRLQIWRDHQR